MTQVLPLVVAIDNDIIDVDEATDTKEGLEDPVQYPLEVRWGITQPKGEYMKGIQPPLRNERHELLAPFRHRDLTITKQQVYLAEHPLATKPSVYVLDVRQGKPVRLSLGVDSNIVETHTPTIPLWCQYHLGRPRTLHGINQALVQ